MNTFKIKIPEPCHEDWNEMTPNENGRFCLSCSKTVIDFTSMLPEEVQHYFIQNQNKKICGRFRKSQLDTITIQIPDRILYSQTHYHKMFLLALFIAMGTTLFSCADNEGNKVKIDKIEVVQETLSKNNDQSKHKDSIYEKPPPLFPNPTAALPITLVATGSAIAYNDDYYPQTLTGTPVAENFEIAPDYPGGFEKFSQFIKNEFQIPEKAKRITGEMEVSFTIEKNGYLNQIKVFDNIGYETGEELIRVLQKSKKWMPGIINSKAIVTPVRLNIVLAKDSLNPERKMRKLSKIISIDIVKKNNDLASIENQTLSEKKALQDSVKDDEIIYMGGTIETKAAYPNGIDGFNTFFTEEFKIPETVENLKERIIISFVVERDGSLSSFQFPKNIDQQLESEIIRVLNLCPKWIPGEQNGKKTREKYSFPISLKKWK